MLQGMTEEPVLAQFDELQENVQPVLQGSTQPANEGSVSPVLQESVQSDLQGNTHPAVCVSVQPVAQEMQEQSSVQQELPMDESQETARQKEDFQRGDQKKISSLSAEGKKQDESSEPLVAEEKEEMMEEAPSESLQMELATPGLSQKKIDSEPMDCSVEEEEQTKPLEDTRKDKFISIAASLEVFFIKKLCRGIFWLTQNYDNLSGALFCSSARYVLTW